MKRYCLPETDTEPKEGCYFALAQYIVPRELPDMMSGLEGGGGSWKSACSQGGCSNFIA